MGPITALLSNEAREKRWKEETERKRGTERESELEIMIEGIWLFLGKNK